MKKCYDKASYFLFTLYEIFTYLSNLWNYHNDYSDFAKSSHILVIAFLKKIWKKIFNSSLYDFIYMVFFNKGAFKSYNLILIYEYRGPEFYKIMEL